MMRLPRPRFGLRTLLVVCTVLCVLLALYVLPAYRQRQAVAALSARGAIVFYTRDLDAAGNIPTARCPFSPRALSPQALSWHQAWLGGDFVDRVEIVDLSGVPLLFDSDFMRMRQFRHLRELTICRQYVSSKMMKQLRVIKSLEYLDVSECSFGDGALESLGELDRLKALRLQYTDVSDDALLCVKRLRRLSDLVLSGTKITDASVEPLSQLVRLKVLDIDHTAIEPAAVAELQRRLPDAWVFSDASRRTADEGDGSSGD